MVEKVMRDSTPANDDDGGVEMVQQRSSNTENEQEGDALFIELKQSDVQVVKESPDVPEGGYGWVVVAAACAARFMNDGSIFGLLFVQLLDQFGRPRGETALVGSICFGTCMFAGPLASLLCNLLGHRVTCIIGALLCSTGFIISAFAPSITLLYFSYGILIGIGLSCLYVTSTVMPNFYFKRRRQIVMGIVVSGTALGQLILPIVANYSIEEFTWRGAMFILAGVALQACVAGALFRPVRKRPMTKTPGVTAQKPGCAVRFRGLLTLELFILGFVLFLNGLQMNMFFTFLPARVISLGCSQDQATFLLSLSAILSFVSRLATGVLMNVLRIHISLVFGMILTFVLIPHIMFALPSLPYGAIVFVVVLFGFLQGAGQTLCPLNIIFLFEQNRMTSALGILAMAEGIGGISGSPLAGLLMDKTGSYHVPYTVSGVICACAGLLNLPLFIRTRKLQNQMEM